MGFFDRFRKKEEKILPKINPAEEMFQKAMMYSNQENYDDAIKCFRKVLEIDPTYKTDLVHYGIGLAYDGKGIEDLATEELRRAISINPRLVDAHIYLGSMYARRNDILLAIQEYEIALRLAPNHELAEEMKRSVATWKKDMSGETLNEMINEVDEFIEESKKALGVILDYSPESLERLNAIIDGGWNPKTGGPIVIRITAVYFGETVVRNLGGRWRIVRPIEDCAIVGDYGTIRPFHIVAQKFAIGKDFSLFKEYNEIKGG